MLSGKKILVGVTGGIAAYKSAHLVRLLIKSGAEVRVVMTPKAVEFITPLTLSVLSKHPVQTELVTDGVWNNHVDLGRWADLLLIAPCTASTLSKMATGQCDNLLMAVYLSAECPVYVAPAMDLEMYRHSSTQDNLKRIGASGNRIIYPATGSLASGLEGEGRMEEPEQIVQRLRDDLLKEAPLHGHRILVTAGPTFEAIDDVRFLGNHSSGKMGFAIAEVLAARGALVELVSGPVALDVAHSNIHLTRIVSAAEMFQQCMVHYSTCSAAVMAAAVADFTPSSKHEGKIKKGDSLPVINLQATADVLEELGRLKKADQVLIGFALESTDGVENAKDKVRKKNLDLIVLNSLQDQGAGFGTDTNKVSFIDKHNKITTFGLKHKQEVAKDIADALTELVIKR